MSSPASAPPEQPTPPTPPADRLARLEAQVAEQERLSVLEDKLKGRWWRQPGWVVAITGLVAAVVPVTSSVQAYLAKELDIELAKVENERAFELAERKARADLALAQDSG